MQKIESFKINHDILEEGIYISRVDGDIVTYDIRTRKPNQGNYMSNAVMHTIEHLFATFVRNSIYSKEVIYFGPMGCRTGFYLLLRSSINKKNALALIRDAFSYIANYSGEIPGARAQECGNYLEHDLDGAKKESKRMLNIISIWTEHDMNYKK